MGRAPRPLDIRALPASRFEVVQTADQVTQLAASLSPSFTIDFRKASGTVPCDVYELTLDRRRQTLQMEAASEARRVSYELEVRRTRAGESQPQVVQRAHITSNHSWAATDANAAATRAVALLMRAIDENSPASPMEIERHEAGEVATLIDFAASFTRAVMHRALRSWQRGDAWFVAYRYGGGAASLFDEPKYLFGGRDRFYADPCAVRNGSDYFVFLEDYDYTRQRGAISVSALRADGTLAAPTIVLERPYHLSYPFVFEHAGDWWMVPETSANRSVDLYRALEFPLRWELHSTLLSDIEAVDATMHYDGTRWWMFVNVAEHGSSTTDELSIYFADDLTGPFRPHPRNPVKCAARSSRPAGRIFQHDGAVIRPAQDCSKVYGGGVRFCRIDVLSETDFAETEIDFLPPDAIPGAVGLHTWSAAGELHVIDARLPYAPLRASRFQSRLAALRRAAPRVAVPRLVAES
jgi:hypothetical protein